VVQRSFHRERLRLARVFRGLTLESLGGRLAVSRQFVQQLEKGTRVPGDELVNFLAQALDFSPNYFLTPFDIVVSERECNFRSRRSTGKAFRERVASYATLFVELLGYLQSSLWFPEFKIPRRSPSDEEDIDNVAEYCRHTLGIDGDRPIGNLTRVLENAGVIVTSFEGVTDQIDAMSVAHPFPFVFFSTNKGSASRTRFDLAHELGHLVMHDSQETGSPGSEREANLFASSFLLPKRAFNIEFPRSAWSWPSLLEQKQRWGASLAAIVRRAYDLRLISVMQYRNANVYFRRRGWHKGEPREPLAEEPEAISLAFREMERTYGMRLSDIANHLNYTENTVCSITGLKPQEASPSRGARILSFEDFSRATPND
jgi:Zn-dependent peptidase ImmA (M78 family)/transcriptional regulator with XRE-family HTH domain